MFLIVALGALALLTRWFFHRLSCCLLYFLIALALLFLCVSVIRAAPALSCGDEQFSVVDGTRFVDFEGVLWVCHDRTWISRGHVDLSRGDLPTANLEAAGSTTGAPAGLPVNGGPAAGPHSKNLGTVARPTIGRPVLFVLAALSVLVAGFGLYIRRLILGRFWQPVTGILGVGSSPIDR